jgi:hypothetical protein
MTLEKLLKQWAEYSDGASLYYCTEAKCFVIETLNGTHDTGATSMQELSKWVANNDKTLEEQYHEYAQAHSPWTESEYDALYRGQGVS